MVGQKLQNKKGNQGNLPTDIKGARTASIAQYYDFGNTPVLLTHPNINYGESVQGYFTGNWLTIQISRSEFEILDIEARLVLPPMDIKLPKSRVATRVSPGSISLSLGNFDVPNYLQEVFTTPNRGVVDVRNRMYRAVFALHADFSFAYAKSDYLDYEPADLLLLTVGTVEKGGVLTASGIGTVISNFLNGLMFSCNHGSKKPKKKKICGALHPTKGVCCTKPEHSTGDHFHPGPPRIGWK